MARGFIDSLMNAAMKASKAKKREELRIERTRIQEKERAIAAEKRAQLAAEKNVSKTKAALIKAHIELQAKEKERIRDTAKGVLQKAKSYSEKCNTTDSISVFFNSWDALVACYYDLKLLQEQNPSAFNYDFASFERTLDKKHLAVNEMLDRYWFSIQEKAMQLTTVKGMQNKLMTFFKTAKLYEQRFDDITMHHLQYIWNQAVGKYGFEDADIRTGEIRQDQTVEELEIVGDE